MIIEQKDNQKRHVHKSGVSKNQKPAFAVALSVYSIYAYRLIHPIIQVEDKKNSHPETALKARLSKTTPKTHLSKSNEPAIPKLLSFHYLHLACVALGSA